MPSEPLEPQPLYRDARQAIPARVDDLLKRMTLEEKAAQLRSIWIMKFKLLRKDGSINPDVVEEMMGDGIGFIGRPVDTMASARISRAGRRLAHVLAEAWQEDATQPIATLVANFLLDDSNE